MRGSLLALGVMLVLGGVSQAKEVSYKFSDANLVVKDETLKCRKGILETKTSSLITERPVLVCGDRVYLPAFNLSKKGGAEPLPAGVVKRIPVYEKLPKEKEESVKKAVKLLEDYGIKPEGKGKELLIVFTDPMCPFCKKGIEKELPKLLEKFRVVVVPYPVHGSVSKMGCALMLKEMKEKGISDGLREVYSHWRLNEVPEKPREGEDYGEFLKRRNSLIAQTISEYGEYLKKGREFPKELELVGKIEGDIRGIVKGTPTFVFCKTDGCYIGIGLPPVGKFVLKR